MKHAGSEALDQLESLLSQIRNFDGLRERSQGVFYRDSQAFLHFHEDPLGLFADIRLLKNGEFERFKVVTKKEQMELLQVIRKVIATEKQKLDAPDKRCP